MISCLVSNIEEDKIIIDGEDFLHLSSALRVKLGDAVLTLDGKGYTRETKVSEVNKKNIVLTEGQVIKRERISNIDILLSPPKRDALNDCLRMSCELGIRKIYLYETEFTQNRKIDDKRMMKILKSSVIQSNNPYLPEVQTVKDLAELNPKYHSSIAFHLCEESNEDINLGSSDDEYLLVIGPEGGLSGEDINEFKKTLSNFKITRLNTPIMRTPTALCAAASWVLSRI